jgi:hypothetical protein
MHSAGKRLAALAVIALAAGCSNGRTSNGAAGTEAYVDVARALAAHPLHARLERLDAAIAVLGQAAASGGSPDAIARERQRLDAELAQAAAQSQAELGRKRALYLRREQEAVEEVLAQARAQAGTASGVSPQQAQQAMIDAGRAFQAYQQSVLSADRETLQRLAGELRAQARREIQAKAAYLQQQESQLSLRLAQEDAPQRLALQTRLSNLALDADQRAAIQKQLAALDAKEHDALRARQERDRAELEAYEAEVQRRMTETMRSEEARLQAASQAKVLARRNEVVAQLRALAPGPVPSALPPATRDEIAQIEQQFQGEFATDAQRTVDAYERVKAKLDAELDALATAQRAAGGTVAEQLAGMHRERDALYARMIADVRRAADTVARRDGMHVVLVEPKATPPPGARDLTGDVIHTLDTESTGT